VRNGRAGQGPGRTSLVRWLLAVALVAAAGCTGRGGSDAPSTSNGSGGGAARQGRSGGTLSIALLDPGPLDPAQAEGLEDEVVLGNLFDGLTTIDASGAVHPAVAVSWTSDPALRRWEFHLRPEARWSDGSPLRSTDFTYAWHRLADPKTKPAPSPAARALLSTITGYRSFVAGRARSITGLETPNPTTLVVQLDHPFADLPALVAALPLSPLPATVVRPDPAAYLTQPVGNGPFRLTAPARPGRSLTLDRNPTYWSSPALLDKVSVHVVPDEQTAWLELQNGRVLFAPIPPDQLAAGRTVYGPSSDGRTTPGLLQSPTLTTWQLTFNLKSKLGRNPHWRQAVSLASDRDRLATTLAGSPATSLVPPATPGFVVGSSSGAAPDCRVCSYNPTKARALFARLSSGGGPVTLAVPPGADSRRIATLVAADLTAAGVKVAGTKVASASPSSGETPVTLVRRVAPYPRPDPFLASPSLSSPPAKRLLDQARATPDDPARATLYQQAEATILSDLTTIPLLTEHHAAVLTSGPQGFNLTPWNTLDLATISLPA
jgi:ABC-type transport system substrate-binding protein